MTGVGGPALTSADGDGLTPALRLQVLTTEHWSLLSTRSMSWNEAFSRVSMFLSALSGSVVALALVAGATGFSDGFMTFALLLLPVVLFAGIGTFARLVAINGEDVRWVIGMNRLRHAYLDAAPELRPYFVTGSSDDEAGIMTTFGAAPGPGGFIHEFVTTPGLVAVVDGVVAGALAAVIALRAGADDAVTLGGAVGVGLLTVALLAIHQYRRVVRPRGLLDARFPSDQAGSSTRKR